MEMTTEHAQHAFRERPHMQCGAACVWFTYPAGVVFQLVRPARLTLQLSGFFVDDVYEEAMRRFPEFRPLVIVLDLSLMTGRTTASRSLLLGRMRESAARCGRVYVALPPALTPALRRSVEASMQLAAELGIEAQLSGSVREVIAACSLACAPHD